MSKLIQAKQCQVCKRELPFDCYPHKKYCNDCAYEVRKKKAREKHAEQKKIDKRICRVCGEVITNGGYFFCSIVCRDFSYRTHRKGFDMF